MAASKTSPAAKHASDPANPAPSSSPKVQNATADSSSLVLQVVQKRIRYVRKRLRTISEIEAKRDSGKALNADQEESLRAKTSLLGLEDELDRLAAMIKPALDEQLAAAASEAATAARSEAQAAADDKIKELEVALRDKDDEMAAKIKEAENTAKANAPAAFPEDAVRKLVGLIYLAQVFNGQVADVPAELTAACKALKGKVTQQQLGALANVGAAVGSPDDAAKTHEEALAACQAAAVAVMHAFGGDVSEDTKVAGVPVADVVNHLPQLLASSFMRGTRTKARRAVATGGRAASYGSARVDDGVVAAYPKSSYPATQYANMQPHPAQLRATTPSPIPADVPVGKPATGQKDAEFTKAAASGTTQSNAPSRNPYFIQQQQQQQPHAHYVPGVMHHNAHYHHPAQYGQHAALDNPAAAVQPTAIPGYTLPDTVNGHYGFVPTDQAPEPESPEPGRPSNPNPALTNVPPAAPAAPQPPATADAVITTASITTASGGRIVTAQRGGGGRGPRYNRGDGGRGRVVTMPKQAPVMMPEVPIQFGDAVVELDGANTVQVPPPRHRSWRQHGGRGGGHVHHPPQATV